MAKLDNGFVLIEEDGKSYYANLEKGIYPIYPLSSKLKQKLQSETHHYCGAFTRELFAALPDTIFVDDNEYIVTKKERMLIISYDEKINLWQCAPTFKSEKHFKSGTPIMDSVGNIVSIIIGSNADSYAISCFDGYSGKFETNKEWIVKNGDKGIIYGDKTFNSREDLYEYLKGRVLGENVELQPILVDNKVPRIILFDLKSGLEVSHSYVRGNFQVVVCKKYDI